MIVRRCLTCHSSSIHPSDSISLADFCKINPSRYLRIDCVGGYAGRQVSRLWMVSMLDRLAVAWESVRQGNGRTHEKRRGGNLFFVGLAFIIIFFNISILCSMVLRRASFSSLFFGLCGVFFNFIHFLLFCFTKKIFMAMAPRLLIPFFKRPHFPRFPLYTSNRSHRSYHFFFSFSLSLSLSFVYSTLKLGQRLFCFLY